MVISQDGGIVSVSKSHTGSVHDCKIRQAEKLLPINSTKLADIGYQGWKNLQRNVSLPYKKGKNRFLKKEQKDHNRKLTSTRIRIEHKTRSESSRYSKFSQMFT